MNGRERGKLLREAIFAAYEAKAEDRRPNRLRPSEMGHECARHLWYRFRWADEHETFEGRMHRLFETGHSQEDRMVSDLRRVGAEVHARNPDNPVEQISITILDGHSKGYLDGIAGGVPFATDEWVLLECKTHSEKSFKALERDGVQIAKPTHYAQMQPYMLEHGLVEGLYIAVNKNNDDVYCEFVTYNPKFTNALLHKANEVIFYDSVPGKINESGTYLTCKWCSSRSVCHEKAAPPVSCRTCHFAKPMSAEKQAAYGISEPLWLCTQFDRVLSLDAQRAGCDDYVPHKIFNGCVSARGTAQPQTDSDDLVEPV
jgi:hypothetical protein